ncbi:hypothetical protein MSG28_004340, partial [Choristoneura fumiferana]
MFSQRIAKVILHSDVVFKFSPLKRTQDDVIRTILQQSSKIVAQRKKERVVDKENGIIRSPEENYKLPAGCHCTIGIWAILRLPIWGPDAEQFRPERWLEPDSLPKSPGAYCSFSLGKRNCI